MNTSWTSSDLVLMFENSKGTLGAEASVVATSLAKPTIYLMHLQIVCIYCTFPIRRGRTLDLVARTHGLESMM